MLIKNISSSAPIKVSVGDGEREIELYIYRIGDAIAKIGVKAPKDLRVVIKNDEGLKTFK